MPHNRYYLSETFQTDAELILRGSEHHHLYKVMRAKPGDSIELINGKGSLAKCVIQNQDKEKTYIKVSDLFQESEKTHSVILALGATKPSSLEWTIEKGTELGADAFWLFPADFSDKKNLSAKTQERLNNIALSATKQCGRLYLPSIEYKPALTKWDPPQGTLFLADPSSEHPFFWETNIRKAETILFFIGPERGFSPKERSVILENFHAQATRLHTNTLRAETVPLVALSLFFSRRKHI